MRKFAKLRWIAAVPVTVLLAACGSNSANTTSAPSTPAATSDAASSALIDASGLLRADQAPASEAGAYTSIYDDITSHCADGQDIAFSINVAVSTLNQEGGHTTNLAFMRGLAPLLGTSTNVGCIEAIGAYETDLDPTLGTPSPPVSIPLTTIPAGPVLPPSGCNGLSWPQAVPVRLVGANLSDAANALGCFTFTAIAPDGHNVLNDPANQVGNWAVTSVSPAVGTPVGKDTNVTLHVVPSPGS
jgi:hypothetical protein